VRAKTTRYSINTNLLGVTASGSEIDAFAAPGPETYTLSAPPGSWPTAPLSARLRFERGVLTHLDGHALAGDEMLRRLNASFGAYGVGRGIYTGDTTIGLKGRIVFECPGLAAILTAHRALEEAVLSAHQNAFKPAVAQKWVELVYKGFFFEPLKRDLEAFLESSQAYVSGEVTVETRGGVCHAVEVASDHLLRSKSAVYAQSADWGVAEAEGFIKLFGQSSTLSARVNPVFKL
jgi:argininosuccinate synthase